MLPLSDYLSWVKNAPPEKRAQGAQLLVRAYSYGDFSMDEEREIELALLMVLEDVDLSVRQALADEIARAERAPYSVLYTLVNDHLCLAEPILKHSVALSEDELIECIHRGKDFAHHAISQRKHLSRRLLMSLADHGGVKTLTSLLKRAHNAVAGDLDKDVLEFSEEILSRILERHGHAPAIREALLCQNNLSPSLRLKILKYNSACLSEFIGRYKEFNEDRSKKFIQTLIERAILDIAAQSSLDEMPAFVKTLEEAKHLTPRLLMRAILSRARLFAAALFAHMTHISIQRVFVILSDGRASCLDPLLERTSIPKVLRPVFLIALETLAAWSSYKQKSDKAVGINTLLASKVIGRCDQEIQSAEKDKILHFLNYFEREALLEEARILSIKTASQFKEKTTRDLNPVLVLRYGNNARYRARLASIREMREVG
jgi:uncharacterized protein (DUF2336 family)